MTAPEGPLPVAAPEADRPPLPDYFNTEAFRMIFSWVGHEPEVGTRIFNVLLRAAAVRVRVEAPEDFNPAALPPLDERLNPLVVLIEPDKTKPGRSSMWLTRSGILDMLDEILGDGYFVPAPALYGGLGTTNFANLADVMSKLHPDRPPYPLPPGYQPPTREQAPPAPRPLVEQVAVNGLHHLMVTPRVVRGHAVDRDMLAPRTRLVVPLMTRIAENAVTYTGGSFPPDPLPTEPSFVGQGVVYIGQDTSRGTRRQQPEYGVEPGVFLQCYDAMSDHIMPGIEPYGVRTRRIVDSYADALRAALPPLTDNA